MVLKSITRFVRTSQKIMVCMAAWLVVACAAKAQTVMALYNGDIPNSKPAPADYAEAFNVNGRFINKVTVPTLTMYTPANPNGTAVVICPGGGYGGLASVHEGADIAHAFTQIGVTAFVLKYRLPSDLIMVDKTIGPLQDVQRAIQIVRENAAKWKINTDRVGVIGFSAGGHLASTAVTHFARAVIGNNKQTSLRPDFGVLIYPVISMGEFTHAGSKKNLIGTEPTAQLVDLYSNEKQVTGQTPPVFLVHATDDKVVPVQNSLMFYQALIDNQVKAEMHIYQAGGHGFGLNNQTTDDKWFDSLTSWMKQNGWLSPE